MLFEKNWIDTVQWHYVDIIRDPEIDPIERMKLKRMIDSSNQNITEMVEYIDSYFRNLYSDVNPINGAKVNSESPAWAMDRLSILILKIYHMDEEAKRTDVSDEHKESCKSKLDVLLDQQKDLSESIDQLLEDIGWSLKHIERFRRDTIYILHRTDRHDTQKPR